jgi:hypothetical protein
MGEAYGRDAEEGKKKRRHPEVSGQAPAQRHRGKQKREKKKEEREFILRGIEQWDLG